MQVLDSILNAVGNTPIVRLNKVLLSPKANLFVKCEFMNPGGSIKDRIGLNIINQAEQKGLLKPGGTIVEATSGNTGMGLAMAAAIRGYKCIFVMADKQSQEKQNALKAIGAEVIICPTDLPAEDPGSYYEVAKKLVRDTPNAFLANQYHNPDNPSTHYHTTGPEIWRQMGSELDVLVAGIGTGGTIVGTSRYLREQNPSIQIVGVDPIGSIYYDLYHHQKHTEPHNYLVEGIGEDFMPSTMDLKCMNDVIRVTDKECFEMGRKLIREEGLLCGASSGAAVAGAAKYVNERLPDSNKKLNILAILPDSSSRYLSKFLNDQWIREKLA